MTRKKKFPATSAKHLPTIPAGTNKRESEAEAGHRARVAIATVFTSRWAAVAVIAAATVAVYWNGLAGPWLFDDHFDIGANPSICRLWPPYRPLVTHKDGKTRLMARPVVNYSFALNYAVSRLSAPPYRGTNVLIHLLAGVTLWAIVRRTLALPGLAARYGGSESTQGGQCHFRAMPASADLQSATTPERRPDAGPKIGPRLALAVALLWTLHPLHTEAVTYVTHRYESLMGLFVLLTLYAVLRGATAAKRAGWWHAAAVATFFLALFSKEVAVATPLLILLYDRAFLAGTFAAAWRQRRRLYLGFAAAWAALAVYSVFTVARGKFAGYELSISPWGYAVSQAAVILHYLRLCLWPNPLVVDYGWHTARSGGAIAAGLAIVGGGALATLWALVRHPRWGFCGAWFFLILAPTSSIFPLNDLAAERRMYLSLAAIVVLLVLGGYRIICWIMQRGNREPAWRAKVGWTAACLLVVAVAGALGVRTALRNRDYRLESRLWQKVVEVCPDNERAQSNYGAALISEGRIEKALEHMTKAVAVSPDSALVHLIYGAALEKTGVLDKAIEQDRKALQLNARFAAAHFNLGNALVKQGKADEAIAHFRKALQLDSDDAESHHMLAKTLTRQGLWQEGLEHYGKAEELDPNNAEVENDFATALHARGLLTQAALHFERAISLEPAYAEAHYNLANLLAAIGQADEAAQHYQAAVRLRPDFAAALLNLGALCQKQGKLPEALDAWRRFLRLYPGHIPVLVQTARILATADDPAVRNGDEALALAGRAVQATSGREPVALLTLADAYAAKGLFAEAIRQAQIAAQLATAAQNAGVVTLARERIATYQQGTTVRQP
jgi:protein O-mannosyl-transferase